VELVSDLNNIKAETFLICVVCAEFGIGSGIKHVKLV
jgi:hypothetical protein